MICEAMGMPQCLPGGFSPSIFAGGLDMPQVAPALALLIVLGAAADMQDMENRMRSGLRFNEWAKDSVAGDLAWDPLKLSTELGVTDRYELQEAEMINGRLAQLALVAYAFIESQMHVRVVDAPLPSLF